MEIGKGVFFVTGGASGLGSTAARLLAGQGARMLVAEMNAAASEALAAELGAAARFVPTNVADEASAKASVDRAVSAFGGLPGLVNCAGIVHAEKTVGKEGSHALEAFRRVIDVNLVGTLNMIRLDGAIRMQPK